MATPKKNDTCYDLHYILDVVLFRKKERVPSSYTMRSYSAWEKIEYLATVDDYHYYLCVDFKDVRL